MPPSNTVKAWSFSRWSTYDSCPARFKYSVIEKRPEPKNDAMARGAAVHDAVAAYLTAVKKPRTVPPEAKAFKELLERLRASNASVHVEQDWAYKRDWTETRWDDWAECWLRVKVDVAEDTEGEMLVIDWKTGKFRSERHQEYLRQMELYALAAFKRYPHVKMVKPRLVYLDAGLVYPDMDSKDLIYGRKAAEKNLQKGWEKRVEPMFKDQTFKPKPGDGCRWCHYRKNNGGPCQY